MIFANFCRNFKFGEISVKLAKFSAIFKQKIELRGRTRFFSPHGFPGFWDSIPNRCKGVHRVDLGESFPTSIYLQNSACGAAAARSSSSFFFWRRIARAVEGRWRERSKKLRAIATEPQHPADEQDDAVAGEVDTIAEGRS